METVELTCIACPKGCRMQVQMANGEIAIQGSGCARGKEYAKNEMMNPMRMVTTILKTRKAGQALLSVRTASPVPKAKVPEVLRELHRIKVKAPIAMGDVVCKDVAGTHIDVIATKCIQKKGRQRRLPRLALFRHLKRKSKARETAE